MNQALRVEIIRSYGSQWRFAQRLDLHESYVSMVVRGRRNLSDEEKTRWAKALGVKVGEIFPQEGTKQKALRHRTIHCEPGVYSVKRTE